MKNYFKIDLIYVIKNKGIMLSRKWWDAYTSRFNLINTQFDS